MIETWKVKNFKSVSSEIDLNFKPLTIFAGPNSSGKSTIIQSILLTAQTIQNPVHSKSVILNGHISKFGNFNDILSKSNASSMISIGFKLKRSIESKDKKSKLNYTLFEETINELSCTFSFSAQNDDVEQLQPKLVNMEIISKRGNELNNNEETKIKIYRSDKTVNERIVEHKIKSILKKEEKSLEYEVELTNNNLYNFSIFSTPSKLKYIGAELMHFLPYRLTGTYNSIENQIQELADGLSGQIRYLEFNFDNEDVILNAMTKEFLLNFFLKANSILVNDKKIPPRLVKMVESKISVLKKEFTVENLQSCLKDVYLKRYSMQLFEENKADFYKLFKNIKKDDYIKTYSNPVHFPENEYINSTFKSKLKYLGPLRDNPRSVYPLEGYADPTDVGFRGENTAAVLDIHKNIDIFYIPSSEFKNKLEVKEEKSASLIEAVMDWLDYLGVATNVHTYDKGKLGHELKVSTDGSTELHDLTNVGVGVSQVLPILVLSLLSPKDSTLIFEQPELHLHPKVQTRLADFFLSLNLLKKQCIVETHSEYLINRLRYLVAISNGDEISKNTIMYFVEKENNESIYKPIEINRYGVIEKWPKGFFDESEEIATALLKAGMNKRKSERT